MTPDEFSEFRKCSQSFEYFCESYVMVEDKETRTAIHFNLWPHQREIVSLLVAGKWIWGLKARRLGWTWLMVAWVVWNVTFKSNWQACALYQDQPFAKDFLDRVRYIQNRLPLYMQVARVKENGKSSDNVFRIDFKRDRHGCEVRALASTEAAGRSLAGDFILFDEAAYHSFLNAAIQAAEPIVETGKGQIVVVSTSNGFGGEYHEGWLNANLPNSKYMPLFYGWSAHPKRSQAWYDVEANTPQSLANPLAMKQEYPATPEEAFESAEGRIYPLFSAYGKSGEKFIKDIDVDCEWDRYRAIDWGGADPFVCLFACIIPGDGDGFTVARTCTNTIREMLAYSWDQNGKPKDEDNHTCDCVRYLAVTPGTNGVSGHLHIYDEIYIPNSAAKGMSIEDCCQKVIDLSGDDNFKLSIADRSRNDSIVRFAQRGISPICGQRHMGSEDKKRSEIEQGIDHVNTLIIGTFKGAEATQRQESKSPALNSMSRFF